MRPNCVSAERNRLMVLWSGDTSSIFSPKNREKVIESLMRSSRAQSLRLYHVSKSNILNKRITS